jgi:DNA primase
MGKISPISIKYRIKLRFNANGIVEKPDIVGAIFGQTEGLLGEELELRDLQKKGKIGRIDVSVKHKDSKTFGEIIVPTALDKTETTIIAAALETTDRIGPAEAKFEVEIIEDVRENKREYIIKRAKELLRKVTETVPESKELEEAVNLKNKISKIKHYGPEKLTAGPDIDKDEIIVVEGRADVVNLIRYGIGNVIAMEGTSMPQTIKQLSQRKTITLFIDGDRGGLLNAKDAISTANIVFVAMAPDGKEVEELTEKEIINCLRKKLAVKDFVEKVLKKKRIRVKQFKKGRDDKIESTRKGGRKRETTQQITTKTRMKTATKEVKEITTNIMKEENIELIYTKLSPLFLEISGSKSAYVLDNKFNVVKKLNANTVAKLKQSLKRLSKEGFIIVIDGKVDDETVTIAEKKGFQYLIAKNFSTRKKHNINLLSF